MEGNFNNSGKMTTERADAIKTYLRNVETTPGYAADLRTRVGNYSNMFDGRIPQITDNELAALYGRIKPVVRGVTIREDCAAEKLDEFIGRWAKESSIEGPALDALKNEAPQTLFWIKDVDPRQINFMSSPMPAGIASGLKRIGIITTYHEPNYSAWGHRLFAPSVAEVLSQIPEVLRGIVSAFETQRMFEQDDKRYIKAETAVYVLEDGVVKKLLD